MDEISGNQIMKLWRESVNHPSKTTSAVYKGYIANTKPLFCLVKCTILALPWSLKECPDAVSDESSDGFKVLDLRSHSSGLTSDEFQRCPDSVVIGSFFPCRKWKRAKKRDLLRSKDLWLNGKSRMHGLAQNLRVVEELTSSSSS